MVSLVELVVGALTGLHGIGWLMSRRWKVGLASLVLSLLVNAVFAFLFIPTAGLALVPQLSLQIGWSLFSVRALHDELHKPPITPPPPNPPYGQLPYGQLPYGQLPYGQLPYGQLPYYPPNAPTIRN